MDFVPHIVQVIEIINNYRERLFVLYWETIKVKVCSDHCRIKGRLNISDMNQKNIELLEKRAVKISTLYFKMLITTIILL